MKAKQFTFKKHKRVGKFSSFDKKYTDVMLNKCVVGSIAEETLGGECRMGLIVENPEGENCKWKWIFLTARAKDEESARNFLNLRFDEINEKYKLHPIDT